MSGHTEGPWQTRDNPYMNDIKVSDADGGAVASVWGLNEEAQANARLIAAAPELLEACKAFVTAEDALLKELRDKGELPDFTEAPWPLVEAMRAAITKATGPTMNTQAILRDQGRG